MSETNKTISEESEESKDAETGQKESKSDWANLQESRAVSKSESESE